MKEKEFFTTDINGKAITFQFLSKNQHGILIEMITEGVFNPNQITFEIIKTALHKSSLIEDSHGVFIKDSFSFFPGLIVKNSLIFALTTSGTVQFRSSGHFSEAFFKGSFVISPKGAINDQNLRNFFIIFK